MSELIDILFIFSREPYSTIIHCVFYVVIISAMIIAFFCSDDAATRSENMFGMRAAAKMKLQGFSRREIERSLIDESETDDYIVGVLEVTSSMPDHYKNEDTQ